MVLMEKTLRLSQEKEDKTLQSQRVRKITLIGVGGCGNNTINRLIEMGVSGVECIAINTDVQHLSMVNANRKLLIGQKTTKGLGAGNKPVIGRKAVLESARQVEDLIQGSDIVIVAAGMGGGTGTGAAPIVADIARNMGAIVVGVITMPFEHEGGMHDIALRGLEDMRKAAHTTVVIDNNKLMNLVPQLKLKNTHRAADSIIANMIKMIVETIVMPSLINLDYTDFGTIMSKGDLAIVGVGYSDAPDRAEEAALSALNHLLLDVDHEDIDGAVIHVSGGPDMTLGEAVIAAEAITNAMGDNAMILWGSRIDQALKNQLIVTLVLTGIRAPRLERECFLQALDLYDLEPHSEPSPYIDFGVELYDIERQTYSR